jgi:bifunctional non-homologous end joining protein LigD
LFLKELALFFRKKYMPAKKSVPKGVKAPFPKAVQPMLATPIKEPTNDADFIYEVKWDGFRIIAHKLSSSVVLRSRKLLDYTKYYSPVEQALKELKHDAVLDGEVVVLDTQGKPDFDALQAYTHTGEGLLVYYVFDLLWLDGYDLTQLPVIKRKRMLQRILPVNNILRYSDDFDDGVALFEQAKQIGLEGIVAKKKDSAYIPSRGNKRTKLWLKVPIKMIGEFVIGGWTESGSGRAFRSLLFGAYKMEN